MKYLLLALLASPVFADDFRISERDKQLHMAVSFGATMAVERIIESRGEKEWAPFIAIGAVIAVGAMKEAADPQFSQGDMVANTIGAVWGGAFCWSF
jgi:hypothetical protein